MPSCSFACISVNLEHCTCIIFYVKEWLERGRVEVVWTVYHLGYYLMLSQTYCVTFNFASS